MAMDMQGGGHIPLLNFMQQPMLHGKQLVGSASTTNLGDVVESSLAPVEAFNSRSSYPPSVSGQHPTSVPVFSVHPSSAITPYAGYPVESGKQTFVQLEPHEAPVPICESQVISGLHHASPPQSSLHRQLHDAVPVSICVPENAAVAAPTKIDGHFAAALDLYNARGYSSALACCNTAHVLQPQRTDILLLMSAIHYQLHNFDQCILHTRQAIALKPDMAEAHSNLANALQKSGQLDLAIVHYRIAIHLKPVFTDAYNNLASALVQKGLTAQAIQCYNLALSIDPTLFVVWNNLGDLWRAQGPSGQQVAEHFYLQAIHHNKQYIPAWSGISELCREMQEYARALPCYKELLKLRAGDVETYFGMGHCYKELKQLGEAEKCYASVLNTHGPSAIALANLAGVYYEQGRLDLAIQTYREAIKLDASFPEVYNNLSNALREAGFLDEAVNCYMTCIRIQCALPLNATVFAELPPMYSAPSVHRLCVVFNNLGGVLKIQGRVQEAISCFQQVRTLQPESPEAHANLASAYKDCGKHDFALIEYRQALTLRPDFPDAFSNYVHSMQCICNWEDREQLFVRLEKVVRYSLASGTLPPVQPFHAMAYPFTEDLALEISKAYADHCKALALRMTVCEGGLWHPPREPLAEMERLKVAFVSSDFGNHPLSHLMGSVFGLMDKSKFEVFCYALSQDDKSEWRGKIQSEVEHFVDVSSWNASDIASQISRDGIHIAVNLNGYTKGAKNEIFALKPAPVQCLYMGFPATAGAEFMPYLITDKIVAPTHLHHCYSEKLALMPDCYFVNDYRQAHMDIANGECSVSRSDVGLPEDKIIFSCSNQLYKYDPETFAAWCKILKRVPNSVLWLLRFPPEGEANVRAEAAKAGISNDRIVFTNVAQKAMHIMRSGLADVFLDTPVCNAHTTGCDVLWSGCPMVTMPLRRMASRVAASLCYAVGCPEMVVDNHTEYEDLAVRLALDHAYRVSLRKKLEEKRLSSPLFDTKKWVTNLEKVFLKMWDIHAQGKDPQTFEV